jgi:hypothetical protein
MLGFILLRLASEVLHSVMGGMAVICLYFAGRLSDPDRVLDLIIDGLMYGGLAAAILYCKLKYLDKG